MVQEITQEIEEIVLYKGRDGNWYIGKEMPPLVQGHLFVHTLDKRTEGGRLLNEEYPHYSIPRDFLNPEFSCPDRKEFKFNLSLMLENFDVAPIHIREIVKQRRILIENLKKY